MRRSISLVVHILIVVGAVTGVGVMLGLDARAEGLPGGLKMFRNRNFSERFA